MRLAIFNISQADENTYKCVAKNPRGETDGSIRLYGELKLSHSPKALLKNYMKSVSRLNLASGNT